MTVWYRIWIYVLPIPMWLAEYFMRTIMKNPEADDFFPSSLAAAALGLVIPVLAPKPVAAPAGIAIPPGTLLVDQKDEAVRRCAAAMLFGGTMLWLVTVYLSIGGHWPADWPCQNVDQKFWIGAILYAVAFGLNEWKERV
ncbi:hypothetical protein [Pseudoduganella armeniaca]|uniref:Uncharacterized protein n=1 Tax=Pseudoduganella armeniaca TaxID=2072590 RepID=A0A2R4CE46_9BURK|nr:hypothetical protein [Pseudoduganella armeniaca]AVR97738.1 hypothetical protein C9I28_20445 [Pseudoduganella armeniaca]